MTGAHLIRWRRLPLAARRYFAALVAPVEIECLHRVGTANPDGTITYEPPYPRACGCESAMMQFCDRNSVRCSRCLRAWGMSARHFDEPIKGSLRLPLVDSVKDEDIAYALKHALG